MTDAEREFFLEHGYLLAKAVLDRSMLSAIREEFEQIWELDLFVGVHARLETTDGQDLDATEQVFLSTPDPAEV